MSATPRAGVVYSLRNVKTGKYLNVPQGNDDNGHQLITWPDYHGDRTFDFFLYPTTSDGSRWWIGETCNGRFVYKDNDTSQCRQGDIFREGLTEFDFAFEQVNGYFRVRNLKNDSYLQEHEPKDATDFVFGHVGVVFGDRCDDKSDLWELEERQTFDEIINLAPVPKAPDYGDIDRLTGFHEPLEKTEPRKLGAVALPHNLVKDQDRHWKAQHSPYYILTRYSQWTRHGYQVYNDGTKISFDKKVTVGMVTENSTQVKETTGISVTAKAAFEYGGASASIESTVSHSLEVTTEHKTSQSQSVEETAHLDREITKGDKAITCWYRDNIFVLTRMGTGTEILRWSTRTPETLVYDCWPKGILG